LDSKEQKSSATVAALKRCGKGFITSLSDYKLCSSTRGRGDGWPEKVERKNFLHLQKVCL